MRLLGVAVLEGRTAEPLMQWRQGHAGVAILARERADASALAGRQAPPDALQVAERFHRGQTVSKALKTLLPARRWPQSTPAAQPERSPLAPSVATVRPA